MNYKMMKPKARYKKRVIISDIESTIKILLTGELNTLPKIKTQRWFREAFKYMQSSEDYERMALLRDANSRYNKQVGQ